MKVHAYFFISESEDCYSKIVQSDSDPLTVYEAMSLFNWDNVSEWLDSGYELEEIPYCQFIVETLELDDNDYTNKDLTSIN